MKTIVKMYADIHDFEEIIVSQEPEALSEFAEQIFFMYNTLDLKACMLRHSPWTIIDEVMFREGHEVFNSECWRELEKVWINYLKEYSVEPNWYEKLSK